jgi:threonine/homoserine/homoserine lactone efflux protein
MGAAGFWRCRGLYNDVVRIVGVIMVILPLVLGACALRASRARRFFSTPKTVRWVQRGTGVAMASAAVAVATR